MKSSRAVVGLVAAFSFTAAIAEDALPKAEVRYVIARADGASISTSLPVAASALDAFAGLYDADAGAMFVYREGDSLTIELPPQFGGAPLRLEAETRDAFVAEGSVRVVFESDANGGVRGLLLHSSSAEVIVARKAPVQRGVVTVHDLADLRRGIVTIHDLADEGVASRSPLDSFVRSY
jgi:hypothetical protein